MRRNTSNFRNGRIYSVLTSFGGGTLLTLVCMFAFAMIMTRADMSDGAIASLGSIAVCVGSYFFSFLVAKKRRKDGILVGLFCGGATFALLFLISLIFIRGSISPAFFSKLSMILICSVIGGIIGVNSKIRM